MTLQCGYVIHTHAGKAQTPAQSALSLGGRIDFLSSLFCSFGSIFCTLHLSFFPTTKL